MIKIIGNDQKFLWDVKEPGWKTYMKEYSLPEKNDHGTKTYVQYLKDRKPYYSPLVIAALTVIILNCTFWQESFLNSEINKHYHFFRSFCLIQLISSLFNLQSQFVFYKWFRSSGVTRSHNCGLSTRGYPLFGFISCGAPLTDLQFPVVCATYVGLLTAVVCNYELWIT